MMTLFILFCICFFVVIVFYLFKISNLLKVIFYKIPLSKNNNTLTKEELTDTLERFRLAQKQDLEHYRLLKKKDAICFSCTDKVCLNHKNEYFICDKYKELGL